MEKLLYLLIAAAILFGIYKIIIDDEKSVGYISFGFSILVFLLSVVTHDNSQDAKTDVPAQNVDIASGTVTEGAKTDSSADTKETDEAVPDESESAADEEHDDGNVGNKVDEDIGDNRNTTDADPETTVLPEISESDDSKEILPDRVALDDVVWMVEKRVYKNDSATTTRGETWSDCIRFGSNNLNSDGRSYVMAVCDREYSKFTAEIAPQEGFDGGEEVTFSIYGEGSEGEFIPLGEFQIDCRTKSFVVEYDISDVEYLYIYKDGDYSETRIAGQYINVYSGMGILMRGATLYR